MNPFLEEEQIKKTLIKNANRNKWNEVIKTYEDNQEAHTAKITNSGDTALHIAIANGAESVVEKLVAVVPVGALMMKNELGNTPLHLAAYQGSAMMCLCIAGIGNRVSTLMRIRNDDDETPFFLAVRHGRKKAFYALYSICEVKERYFYCRKKDGETILHSAISGEYFDLAFFIMSHHDKLLNAITEFGFSPLHILANKPSAFRSGSHIRGLNNLIYHCIFVDELQLNNIHAQAADLRYKEDAKYPKNYHTCVGAFSLLRNAMQILLGLKSKEQDEESINAQKQEAKTPEGHQFIDKLRKQMKSDNLRINKVELTFA